MSIMEDQSKSAQLPLASAALVELKAELSRKKEEFQREKASNIHTVKVKKLQKVSLKKKADVWDQKNAGVSGRAQKDLEQFEPEENEDALLKSKLILERKSKIYDAISSSRDIPEEDGREGYLVDFQKKYVDALVEEREIKRRLTLEEQEEEEEEERKALAEPVPEPENSDEEWVDYTDSLGRSRRCMRKDLKDLQKKDQDLPVSVNLRKSKQDEPLDGKDANTESPHLMSDDMYREKMRKKWEDEARQLLEKGQEEIHYANVQFDEIRTHGVGFYQFSKDQEEREAQMEKLNKLRDETKNERSRSEMIKDKRKALMEARLAKVRDRRKLKAKETLSADKDAETDSKPSEADIEEKKKAADEKRVKEEAEKAAEEARKKFVREWDKKKVASSWKGDGYVESRRQEREAQFAPPSIYFNDTNPSSKTSSYNSDFGNTRFLHGRNKTFHESNNKNDHEKTFRQSSSSLKVSESSDAKPATQLSKVTAARSRSASSFETPPIHSIPLPSDVKSPSENSGLSSHIPNFHHDYYIHTEAVQQSDGNYSGRQPQHCASAAGNMQGLGLYQGPTDYISTTHQVCWPQPQQVSWPQQQCFPHQPPQPQAVEPANHPYYNQIKTHDYANPNQATADIPSGTVPGETMGVKRLSLPGTDNQTSTSTAPKKPKVPKSAILDNRFMLNSEATQPSGNSACTTETCSLLTVKAVPYQPGSFTDAKFKLEASDEEPAPLSRGKSQISGGPMLYTKEQRQQQLLQMENEGADKEEVNDKVEEFLKSVRNEIA